LPVKDHFDKYFKCVSKMILGDPRHPLAGACRGATLRSSFRSPPPKPFAALSAQSYPGPHSAPGSRTSVITTK